MKGLILTGLALIVGATSFTMWRPAEPVEASVEYCVMTHAEPVEVPYLDMDLRHLAIVTEYRQTHEKAVQATEEPKTGEYTETTENASEWLYYGDARITHYCPCEICCGEWATGCTASGVLATPGHTVAAGDDLPFGTEVLVNGQVYTVEDRGVENGCIDIFVTDHQDALNRGLYYAEVYYRCPDPEKTE